MRSSCCITLLALQFGLACNDKQTSGTPSDASHSIDAAVTNEAVIIDSVKALYRRVTTAANKADADMLIRCFSQSAETSFVTQDGNVIRSYDSLYATLKRAYAPVAYQSIPEVDLDVHVLSDRYAIGTAATEYTFTLKDSSRLGGPVASTILCVKEAGGWKVIKGHQSLKWRQIREARKQ